MVLEQFQMDYLLALMYIQQLAVGLNKMVVTNSSSFLHAIPQLSCNITVC